MIFKKLKNTDVQISSIGLGAMPLSLKDRPPEEQSIKVIHYALDSGVNLIDTADSYCIDDNDFHHNERLIAKALRLYRGSSSIDDVIIATKGGLVRPGGDWVANGSSDRIRKTIRESFEALGGSKPIPLWQLHAIDPKYDLEKTLEPVREAIDQGLIRFVGVSNFNVEQIKRAQQVVPLVSVQNQFNPWFKLSERNGVLDYCEKNNLLFLPWSPLGGSFRHKQLLNIKPLNDLALDKQCTVYSLVLAWIMHKSKCVVPIPGATRIESIQNSISSIQIKLSDNEIRLIDQITDKLSRF
jgi:aryl-alcohol dehydrogenase-like predicted oxidoreductase